MNDTVHSELRINRTPEYKHGIQAFARHNGAAERPQYPVYFFSLGMNYEYKGYQPESFDDQTEEIDTKIGFKNLNLVHWISYIGSWSMDLSQWILISKRMDILTGIVEKFFRK